MQCMLNLSAVSSSKNLAASEFRRVYLMCPFSSSIAAIGGLFPSADFPLDYVVHFSVP